MEFWRDCGDEDRGERRRLVKSLGKRDGEKREEW